MHQGFNPPLHAVHDLRDLLVQMKNLPLAQGSSVLPNDIRKKADEVLRILMWVGPAIVNFPSPVEILEYGI